jgi:antitoxin VapB
MSATAKVFMNGRSQAIRLPKEFRVAASEVRLNRVPGGILISESDPWDRFEEGCRQLDEGFFHALDGRHRDTQQQRDFAAGIL